jgi:hypothetical protein
VPDRILIAPGGVVIFIEFKAPGKKATPLQKAIHEELRRMGCRVHVVDSVDLFSEIVQSALVL